MERFTHDHPSANRRNLALAAVMVAILAATLAACGSSGGTGDSTSAGESAEGSAADYSARLDALFKGTYVEPSGKPVTAKPGKSIWVISVGQAAEAPAAGVEGVEEAAARLGWRVSVFDGKFESTKQLTGIEQALAVGAEGIITVAIDCAPVKAGLQAAKEAGVPTVSIEGADCSPSLYTHTVRYADNMTYAEWIEGWGAAQAAWVIAETEGKAKVITNTETDLATTRAAAEGVKAELAKCPGCEIVGETDFVGTELGPPLQQKIEQAFIKAPEANSFIASYDAALTSGGAQALKATGRLDELAVMGGEGSAPGIQLIRDHAGMDACVGINTKQEAYGSVDALVRIFAGRNPEESNTGIGWQVCDAEHNLPPNGESYQPPIDYVAAYEGLWGIR